MRLRSIAIRAVLIAAALASVATSPPDDYAVFDSGTLDLTGPVTVRAYARANLPAYEHADELRLELRIYAAEPQPAVFLVPDDPSQPVVEAVLADRFWLHNVTLLRGDPCPFDTGAGCELGVSIEVPEGVAITVELSGQALRHGDPSFFFPEDRQFPADATFEVGFDE
jgi:hypothetical protein